MSQVFILTSSQTQHYSTVGSLSDSGNSFPVYQEPSVVTLYSNQYKNGINLTKVSSNPTGLQWSYDSTNAIVRLGINLSQGETVFAYLIRSHLMRTESTQNNSTYMLVSSTNDNARTKLHRIALTCTRTINWFENVVVSVSNMYTGANSPVSVMVAPDINGQPGEFSNSVTLPRVAQTMNAYFWVRQTVARNQNAESGVFHTLKIQQTPVTPSVYSRYVAQPGVVYFELPWNSPEFLILSRITYLPSVQAWGMKYSTHMLVEDIFQNKMFAAFIIYTQPCTVEIITVPVPIPLVVDNTNLPPNAPVTMQWPTPANGAANLVYRSSEKMISTLDPPWCPQQLARVHITSFASRLYFLSFASIDVTQTFNNRIRLISTNISLQQNTITDLNPNSTYYASCSARSNINIDYFQPLFYNSVQYAMQATGSAQSGSVPIQVLVYSSEFSAT